MDYLNSTINCQIQNEYDSTEAVFNQQDFHAIFRNDTTSSIDETTDSVFDFQLQDTPAQKGDEKVYKGKAKTLTLRVMLT